MKRFIRGDLENVLFFKSNNTSPFWIEMDSVLEYCSSKLYSDLRQIIHTKENNSWRKFISLYLQCRRISSYMLVNDENIWISHNKLRYNRRFRFISNQCHAGIIKKHKPENYKIVTIINYIVRTAKLPKIATLFTSLITVYYSTYYNIIKKLFNELTLAQTRSDEYIIFKDIQDLCHLNESNDHWPLDFINYMSSSTVIIDTLFPFLIDHSLFQAQIIAIIINIFIKLQNELYIIDEQTSFMIDTFPSVMFAICNIVENPERFQNDINGIIQVHRQIWCFFLQITFSSDIHCRSKIQCSKLLVHYNIFDIFIDSMDTIENLQIETILKPQQTEETLYVLEYIVRFMANLFSNTCYCKKECGKKLYMSHLITVNIEGILNTFEIIATVIQQFDQKNQGIVQQYICTYKQINV